MDVRAMTIEVLRLRTRVLVAGEDNGGEPVILIHGVGGWAENWRAAMEPIATTGRRVYAVDLPGHGESDEPGRVSHFAGRDPFYAAFMVGLLDGLGLRSAHVVGHSMGGAVAYMTAVTAPARTRSLTLVAPGGLGTDLPVSLRLATLPGMIPLAKRFGRPAHAREVLRTCFYDAARIPEILYDEAERYGLASYPEFVRALRSGATFRGVRPGLRDAWVARAGAYGGPVLILWGREDAVLPVHHLAAAHEIVPRAEVRIIERCGHLLIVERTEEFLGALLPFLDGAERAVAA